MNPPSTPDTVSGGGEQQCSTDLVQQSSRSKLVGIGQANALYDTYMYLRRIDKQCSCWCRKPSALADSSETCECATVKHTLLCVQPRGTPAPSLSTPNFSLQRLTPTSITPGLFGFGCHSKHSSNTCYAQACVFFQTSPCLTLVLCNLGNHSQPA